MLLAPGLPPCRDTGSKERPNSALPQDRALSRLETPAKTQPGRNFQAALGQSCCGPERSRAAAAGRSRN